MTASGLEWTKKRNMIQYPPPIRATLDAGHRPEPQQHLGVHLYTSGTRRVAACLKTILPCLFALGIAAILLFGGIILAGGPSLITPFSTADPDSGLPDAWKPLTFPKIPIQTSYRPVSMDGRTVIEAKSRGGASGLIHELDVDPRQTPWLSWQWRVQSALEGADVTTKAGDDCAARIYVAFKFDRQGKNWWERFKHGTKRMFAGQEIPGSAIVYAWANGVDVGSIIDSPYTNRSKLIAVQSGNDLKGQWIDEKRNLIEDYRSAYGTVPPSIMGIAIMTDTDNTGAETTAYYADIRLVGEAPGQ